METLKLNTCTISKRGKGAKGTVTVETFGIPVVSKKDTSGITKKWSYATLVEKHSFRDILDSIEQVGKMNQRLIKEALLRGFDAIKKSRSIQENSEKSGLARYIHENGLALTRKTAEDLASIWQQTQAFMKKSNMAVPSLEDLTAQRKIWISDQLSKGLWDTKLVKTTEEEFSDVETDEDSDDSEEDSE